MTDSEILDLYSQWSEDYYCAGFLIPSPENIKQFRNWLKSRQLPSRPPQTVYEQEMLKEFNKQNESLSTGNLRKKMLEDYI